MFLDIDIKDKDKEAVVDDAGVKLTYGQLACLISDTGSYIERRAVVFNLCENTVGSLIGYLSFVDREAVPIMLSNQIDRELLDELIEIYKPAYLWIPKTMGNDFRYGKVFDAFGYVLLKTGDSLYEINDKLELCMTTSGSTGSPKLVRYKKGNLEKNAKNVALAFGWTDKERAICDLGMQYTMGLNVINTHLWAGATVLLTTCNLMNGDFWEFIKKERGTNFTGVPFSYDILYRLRFEKMDLPHLTTLSQGGGKLTDERFCQLAMYAARTGKRFIASFGTTETSARMACLPPDLALSKIGSIGRAIPEGELFLIDEYGKQIDDKVAEGELCYRGPNVTMGYAFSKDDFMKGDDFKGVYHTGDLARRDEDGCYYVTGRLSRFLKLLGYRVSLDQCERLIRQKFQVDCACSGTDQKMNIYITDQDKEHNILTYISNMTDIYKSLFKVYVVDEILRGDNGKIQYKSMDEKFASEM